MADSPHMNDILIVSSTEKFTQSIRQLLSKMKDVSIRTAASTEEASRLFGYHPCDFMIINYPVGDHAELQFASSCVRKSIAAVVLIAKAEMQSVLYDKVQDQGIYLLTKPLSAQTFLQAFRWMVAMRYRLNNVVKTTVTLEEKMDEIRLVNRAKWALISNLKMSESEAHYYIEKQAMNRCTTKAAIAESILQTYTQQSCGV